MLEVMPTNSVNRLERGGSFATGSEPSNVEVSSFSKSWPCLFPPARTGDEAHPGDLARRVAAGARGALAPGQPDLCWTAAFPKDERRAVTIYVSRKADVAPMDGFIGPKG
jgi:hypothetical protein